MAAETNGAIWNFVSSTWDSTIIPTLCEYIKVPNASPLFDKEWATNGHLDKAVQLLVDWVKKQNVKGLELEVVRLENRTPLIFMTVPSTKPEWQETVLLYGHLDKQPPLTEAWEKGLGPYTPVIRDGKLFGRGGADDGYSTFAAITSIKALQENNVPHARCIIMIEACEESGSLDLPAYVEHLQNRIGVPSLIVCLDSGCGNYEQLWLTTSLRGMLTGDLKVTVLKEGAHSGHASGIVPSSFRILRQLLSRLEDEKTGQILPQHFHVAIPEQRIQQTKSCANALGTHLYEEFAFAGNTEPVNKNDLTELLLNRTWRPQLSITGAAGLPNLSDAGNVLRTHTAVKVSLRIPPTLDPLQARDQLKKLFEENPPYNAHVEFEPQKAGAGWESPALQPWLETALHKASNAFYNKPATFIGEGGSIPFMGMLGKKFPNAQFAITGVLGPASNAHGPNEMLHIDMGKKITACVSSLLADHYAHFAKSS